MYKKHEFVWMKTEDVNFITGLFPSLFVTFQTIPDVIIQTLSTMGPNNTKVDFFASKSLTVMFKSCGALRIKGKNQNVPSRDHMKKINRIFNFFSKFQSFPLVLKGLFLLSYLLSGGPWWLFLNYANYFIIWPWADQPSFEKSRILQSLIGQLKVKWGNDSHNWEIVMIGQFKVIWKMICII